MYKHDNFQKFIDLCDGNRYEATNLVANLARSLTHRYNNLILHSEAIQWILTGEKPKVLDETYRIRYKLRSKKLSPYVDILCSIDDEEIKSAVQSSFTESKKVGHLTYLYNNISDVSSQARVRILVRMLWYNYNK